MFKHNCGAFLAIVVALATLLPSAAMADVITYSDSWSDSYQTQDDDGSEPDSSLYGYGVTELTYSDPTSIGVETWFRSPTGSMHGYNSAFTWSTYARANINTVLDWDSSPEGDWQIVSDHWYGGGIWSTSFLWISVRRQATRYYLVGPLGGVWYYSNDACGSTCQKPDHIMFRGLTFYVQGRGWYTQIFGARWCSMKHNYSTVRGQCFG